MAVPGSWEEKMKRIGLVVNYRKARGGRFLDILKGWFEQRGISVVLPRYIETGEPSYGCPLLEFTEDVDIIMTVW